MSVGRNRETDEVERREREHAFAPDAAARLVDHAYGIAQPYRRAKMGRMESSKGGLVLLALLAAVGSWAWRLGRRPDVPSFVPRVTYVLVGLIAALDLCGLSSVSERTWGDLVGGIYIALAWLSSSAPIAWTLFCTWRWGPTLSAGTVLLLGVAGSALAGFVGYRLGASVQAGTDRDDRDSTIAFRWSDGEVGDGKAIRVYEVWGGGMNEVHASIGTNGPEPWHELGVIGRTKVHPETVRRFSVISWRPDGVHFGTESHDEFFLPRDVVGPHH